MSFIDKAKNKVEEVVGEFKEHVGEAYGNEALELDGEAEADAAREREAELDAREHKPNTTA
ncbi:MAG: CsbD family protein [Geodermatophilaceae bacterium]|nr:CsbD family protein [Geodermatophilaceae bacterium]